MIPSPSCEYPVDKLNEYGTPMGSRRCGAIKRLYSIKGPGSSGESREMLVCEEHLLQAWENWSVDSAVLVRTP